MFPIRFDGNCIFATHPLMQCKDDGSNEDPLVLENDIAAEIDEDNSGDQNAFSNADDCQFFEPLETYPKEL